MLNGLLNSQIHRGARLLGLDLSDPRVTEAKFIGAEALASGYSLEVAYEVSRRVMLAGLSPAGGTFAA